MHSLADNLSRAHSKPLPCCMAGVGGCFGENGHDEDSVNQEKTTYTKPLRETEGRDEGKESLMHTHRGPEVAHEFFFVRMIEQNLHSRKGPNSGLTDGVWYQNLCDGTAHTAHVA